MITTVIALALLGCGGGESNSGGGTTVVKNYTIDFLDVRERSSAAGCQTFGYVNHPNADKTKLVAYRIKPERYDVYIHYETGFLRQHYRSVDLNSTFTLPQNEIPEGGYLSFARLNEGDGISHITTFSKELLPDNFAIQARGDITQCLAQSGTEPRETNVEGYIARRPGAKHVLSGFNTAYQNLDDITKFYQQDNPDNDSIPFLSLERPLLAINYETDEEGKAIQSLMGFKFTPFTQRGTSGDTIRLDPIVPRNTPWHQPTDIDVENAFLFVNGKKRLPSANYAYLWQPFIQNGEVIHDKFGYADTVGDDNYYLYLEGKQDTAHSPYWGVKHVVQGTNNGGASLSADNILDSMPEANTPTLAECTTDPNRQCLTINTGSLSTDDGVQRVLLRAKLATDSTRTLRHVFYTPVQTTLPILKSVNLKMDKGLVQDTASVSFLISKSPEIREAFLYQHQSLAEQNLSNLTVDFIPLLKNHAAQQDLQDKLKRHPYTWVWLKTDNH